MGKRKHSSAAVEVTLRGLEKAFQDQTSTGPPGISYALLDEMLAKHIANACAGYTCDDCQYISDRLDAIEKNVPSATMLYSRRQLSTCCGSGEETGGAVLLISMAIGVLVLLILGVLIAGASA